MDVNVNPNDKLFMKSPILLTNDLFVSNSDNALISCVPPPKIILVKPLSVYSLRNRWSTLLNLLGLTVELLLITVLSGINTISSAKALTSYHLSFSL